MGTRPGFCRITVNGRPCPVLDERLLATASYIVGPERGPLTDLAELGEWLTADAAQEHDVGDFLAWICRGALESRVSVLLGRDQEAAYLERLALKDGRSAIRQLPPALTQLLDLWISIADMATIASTVSAMPAGTAATRMRSKTRLPRFGQT